MHIGFDGSRLDIAQRTGTENYSYEILKHMLTLDRLNQYTIYSRHSLPSNFVQPPQAMNKVIPWPRLWTQAGLAFEIIKRPPDVLFVPAHTLPVIHRPGLKSVVTIHDLGAEYLPQYHTFPGKLYLNRSTDYAVRVATHLIAVSQFTKADLVRRYNLNPERITVIYEGVDLSSLKPVDPSKVAEVKSRFNLQQPYVLFVGTIQPRKNLIRLIESIAKVKDKDINLVLAGKNGWLSEEIYQAPERFNLASRIKFLGYVEDSDKAALYTGARLTILPSLFEGFGLPLLESMACGTPVIAAGATSLPEVVGSAGLLVDPHDPHDIAQAIDRLHTDENLRQACIAQGFSQARLFSWSRAAQKTIEVLEGAAHVA